MPLSFWDFVQQMQTVPFLPWTAVLILSVLVVNGWTDAPNAIAGVVATGALPFSSAVLLAAVCNFFGVLCVTSANASVAETVYSIASFSGDQKATLAALCAAMAAIVVWAAGAWCFGIPTSESHALVAGITGGAIALEGSLSCVRWESWGRVLAGLLLSSAAGFCCGALVCRRIASLKGQPKAFRRAQLPGAAALAFLHGAQDGQKFLGIFFLSTALARGEQSDGIFRVPLWMMILCALFMALGTLMGGRRIIETVGQEMVAIGPREGLAADLASGMCLMVSTLLGLPVSTTHTRTAALLGVGAAGQGRVDRSIVSRIVLAWILTFPGCLALGYGMARVFLSLLR